MKRTFDMMNLRAIKWWKAALMFAITVFFLYLTVQAVGMLRYSYSNWIVNRMNVQQRVYEALSMLSVAGIALLICASCFIASLQSLIHCFFPQKRPSVFARLTTRYGGYPALIAFVVFVIFLIIQLALGNVIGNTPEVDEVPATLNDRIISCWLDIPLVLAFEITIVMFVSWIQSRRRKTQK